MKENITDPNRLTLAELISEVLHHPELPEPLYEGIMAAIADCFNSADQSELVTYEESAPYINLVIRGYHKKNAQDFALPSDPDEWPSELEGGVQ